MAGSGSCAASMSTSAGTAWWLEMRMTSPTCRRWWEVAGEGVGEAERVGRGAGARGAGGAGGAGREAWGVGREVRALMSVQTESRRVAPRLHCAGELLASLSALWRARSCTRGGGTVVHAGPEQGRWSGSGSGAEEQEEATHARCERQWGAVIGGGGTR